MKLKGKHWLKQALLATALLGSPLAMAQAQVGEKAPDFQLVTLQEQTLDLKSNLGKRPVYLKFWATWCSYCLEEMPHLEAAKKRYGDQLAVLAINVGLNDNLQNVQKLFRENGYTLPVAMDQQGRVTALYEVIGTPSHILIDKDGEVRYRTHLVSDELDVQLKHLVEEPFKFQAEDQ